MSVFLTELQKFQAAFGASAAPEIQEAIAAIQTAEAKVRAALPAIAVIAGNEILDQVPFGVGKLLEPALDPGIKGLATLGEDKLFALLDHSLSKASLPAGANGAAGAGTSA